MAWIEFFFGIICRVHFRRKTHSFQHEYEKFVKRRLGDLVWFQFQVFSQSSQNWVILRMEFGKNCGFKTLLFSLTMYSVQCTLILVVLFAPSEFQLKSENCCSYFLYYFVEMNRGIQLLYSKIARTRFNLQFKTIKMPSSSAFCVSRAKIQICVWKLNLLQIDLWYTCHENPFSNGSKMRFTFTPTSGNNWLFWNVKYVR